MEFYHILESYIWEHPDKNLHIVIYNRENSFEIVLCINNKEVDSFLLKFDSKDRELYEYLSLFIMVKVYENVKIFYKDNVIYNPTHKDYVTLLVSDEEIMDKHKYMITLLNNYQSDDVYGVLESMYFKIKRRRRKVEKDVIDTMDYRIHLTKKLILGGAYE